MDLSLLFKSQNKLSKLALSFIVSAIACTLVSLLCEFKYLTNDDWAIMQIVSGGLSGYSSPYLCFTNVIIGEVLVFLYNLDWGINWYTYYLLAINFISWVAILYVFLRVADSIKMALLTFTFMFILLLMRYFFEPQFTITAATIFISGLALLWINRERIRFNAEVIIGMFFIILSGLIREDVLIQMILGIIPILIFQLFRKEFMVTIAIVISIVIYGACAFYDNTAYQNDERWADFKELLGYRELENKYLTYENMKDVLTEIEWSGNDFNMYKYFLSDFDNTVFTKERVIYMTEQFRAMDTDKSIYYGFESMGFGMKPHYAVIALIIVTSMIWVNKRRRIMLASLYLWTLLGCFAVGYKGYIVKERVIYDYLLLWGIFGALYAIEAYKEGRIKNILTNRVLVIILLILSSWNIYNMAKKNNVACRRCQENSYKKYIALESLDLPYYSGLLLYYPDCLGLFELQSNRKMYCLGWLAGIPFNKEKIDSQGIKHEVNSVYDKGIGKVVWLFEHDQRQRKDMITTFYREHYGTDVTISETRETLTDNFIVDKVIFEFK